MTKQSVRILVVGGSGFIGRHIVHHAAGLGWDVTSLNLSGRFVSQENSLGVHCVTADVGDHHALRAALEDPSFEYVVNCGGYVDHTLFFNRGRRIFDIHFGGVLNLAEILNRDVLRSFVHLGSSDEYGCVPAPQIETQRESPISPYSSAKVATTHFLQMLHRTENFPSTILRLFLTYGFGQDSQRLLPQVIRACLEDRSFSVSEGRQLRDFCFVEDTVNAVFRVFDSLSARGEVINIGSGLPISVRQVIETIQRLIGRGKPRFGEITYRPCENMELYADISKAEMLLDWKPKADIETGLEKTIQWIKNQP